jgi:beta-lactamase regulating signal transducer with metallopeptidase domain
VTVDTILEPVLRTLAGIAVDVAWKSAVVLLAAGALVLVLRRASAAARHLAWCLGLAGSLVLPALTLVVPVWVWPILPVHERPEATLAAVQPSFTTAASVWPPRPLPVRLETPSGNQSSPDAADSNLDAPSGTLRLAGSRAIPPAPQVSARIRLPSFSLWAWLAGVWAGVAGTVLLAPIPGRIILKRLARGARPIAGGDWSALLHALRTQLRLTRPVTLLESDRAVMPMTWGWLRPVILVPVEADHWTVNRRRDVLLHELAHIRRLDCLTQAIGQLACAVYWPNPLAWLAAHRMRVERERACDDLVLRAGSQASDYAQHLLEEARALRAHRAHSLAALAMARPSALEGRLLAILDPRCPRRGATRTALALGLVALAVVTLPLSTVRLGSRSAEAGPPRHENAAPVPSPQDKPPSPSRAPQATVVGSVVDPQGKPVSGARLVMFAERRQVGGSGGAGTTRDVWSAQSDAGGRFQFEFPLIPAEVLERLYVEAAAPGFGFDAAELKTDVARQETTVTMVPERIVEGRLIDIHGQPAAGVSVGVRELNIQKHRYGSGLPGDVPSWPLPVTTGPGGHFRLHGTSERAEITLEIDDPRFAHQLLVLAAGDEGRARPRTMALLSPQVIDVRVVRGDDGKPMAGAWVVVQAGEESTGARADDQGHARISSWSGASLTIVAYAKDGEPYIRGETGLAWPKGAVQQAVEVKLRRGVILRGKLVEEPSGKPVVGAGISYYQTHRNNPLYIPSYNRDTASASPDGTFTLAVPYGPGHLLVQGPSTDYLHETTSHGELGTGWGPNLHMYPDAVADLDLKREEATHPVELRLRRGVTVKGRVIGPDGSPVAEAFAMGRTYVPYNRYRRPFAPFSGGGPQLPVRDGRFEIPGCDSEKPHTFHFLDVQHQLGATVEISGKAAATGPVTVQLEKCGRARVRFKDPFGKPVAGQEADEFPGMMTLIITPGADFGAEPTNADMEFQVNLDPRRNGNLRTGSDGRATFVSLIPGARYRYRGHEFTAKADQTIDLPDVTVPREPRR